jgi:hypothetical protein
VSQQIQDEPVKDHTLEEAAAAIRMSSRWLRQQIRNGEDAEKADAPFIEHTKRGHKILFTDDQLEKLRGLHAKAPAAAESITTGRKRRSA